MFRWVVWQLDSLQKCLKLDALRKAPNTLPKTLNDTYERILSNPEEEYEEYALKIFQWLCFSTSPVQINEMVEVLAMDLNDAFCFRSEQRLPDPRDILTICSTLMSVTPSVTEGTPMIVSGLDVFLIPNKRNGTVESGSFFFLRVLDFRQSKEGFNASLLRNHLCTLLLRRLV